MQGSLFPRESKWTPPADFPELEGDFALDLETKDPLLKERGPGWAFDVSSEIRGYVVGYAIGAPGFQAYYPIRHEGGGNLDLEPVLKWLRAQCKKPGHKVFHNGLYDLGWASTDGIEINPDDFHDTQFEAALLDENQLEYNLDFCLRHYLGEEKDETLLRDAANDMRGHRQKKINPKEVLWALHSKYVGPYGEQDGGGTWRLHEKLYDNITRDNLTRVYDLERRLMPILLAMRRQGVPVDLDRAEQVRAKFIEQEREAIAFIHRETGCRVRSGVPSADAAQILKRLGISIPQTAAGNDTVVAKWLENLDHPIGKMIVRARKFNKAYRDFIDSGIFGYQINGRIHASFHPLMSDEGGTVSGRFSCTNPNLQQIPARDPEIGPDVRSCYVAPEGKKWGKFDFSSQEPRWTLHFAHAIGAPGAAEAVRQFRENPRLDFHGMMTGFIWPEVQKGSSEFKGKRRKAKDIFLGMCYGMGGAKLCRTLNLPTGWWKTPDGKNVEVAGEEGRELINHFNRMAPFVKKLQQEAAAVAERRGYVITFGGRRCRLDGFFHKALNRIIQGTSADQIKQSIYDVYVNLGLIPLLQVHDENGYPIECEYQAKQVSEIMQNSTPGCVVPHVCDPLIGNSWGECKD